MYLLKVFNTSNIMSLDGHGFKHNQCAKVYNCEVTCFQHSPGFNPFKAFSIYMEQEKPVCQYLYLQDLNMIRYP